MQAEKCIAFVKKYRHVALIFAVGVVLMLLPDGGERQQTTPTRSENTSVGFSLEDTERRLEELLGNMQGVGQVNVMLTLEQGSTLSLAQNSADSRRDTEIQRQNDVLTVDRADGEDVVVTQERYPVYQGAVVVCQGAGDSAVRLGVIEAVSVLTGLGSDEITVLPWK